MLGDDIMRDSPQKLEVSPQLSASELNSSTNVIKEYGAQNINEISMINKVTQDTSMNTSNYDLIKKLQNNSGQNQIGNDKFETGSSLSYFFNEEEMANYEENIQQKINEVWQETQEKLETIQNDY